MDVIRELACELCEELPRARPCDNCVALVRDVVLAFLDALPAVHPITPLELRMQVATQTGDA